MKYALLLALAAPMFAQEWSTRDLKLKVNYNPNRSFRVSQGALLASTFADVVSSRGMVERNPVLGRGDFRMARQGARALGISAGVVLVQELIVRRWPSTQRVFKYTNWIGTGGHGVMVLQNWTAR